MPPTSVAAVLRGGDAEAGIVLAGPPHQVRVVVVGNRREEASAGRGPRPRPAGGPSARASRAAGRCSPPSRIGRGRGDARLIQRHAVADRHVARGVDDPDRAARSTRDPDPPWSGGAARPASSRRSRRRGCTCAGPRAARAAARSAAISPSIDDVSPAGGGARSTQSSSRATWVNWPWPSTKPGTNVRPPRSTSPRVAARRRPARGRPRRPPGCARRGRRPPRRWDDARPSSPRRR